jgi:hypothetical protein
MDGSLPNCECLKGYVPKIPQQWELSHWKDGCVPRNESNCKSSTEGFFKYRHMKYPDTSSSWFDKSLNLEECKAMCLRNCSCVAYANLDTRNGGTGCLLWFNYLVDVREFTKWGQDIYVKVPLSELGTQFLSFMFFFFGFLSAFGFLLIRLMEVICFQI